jgi:hypothetical protein
VRDCGIAEALALTVPYSLLARADAVIEKLICCTALVRLWPTAPLSRASSNPGRRRGYTDKFCVRYTFNCAQWFSNFEHLLAA